MNIRPLKLNGAYEIDLDPHSDARGYFVRTFDVEIFRSHGLANAWKQESESLSLQSGTIRGLHFQVPPQAETKLVRVTAGEIWDVLVDLRRDSETYGQWDALVLSSGNLRMVYIPPGFAHGFCTLTDMAVVQYKMDAYFAPVQKMVGLRWDDETLAIPWPTKTPIVSEKDRMLSSFKTFVSPFVMG